MILKYYQKGYTTIHQALERSIAEFVGKESAIIFEMGYATNSTTLPAIVKKVLNINKWGLYRFLM